MCFIFRPFVLVNMRLKNKITEEGLLLLRKEQSTQCWQNSLNGFYFYPCLKDIALAHAIPTRLSVRSWKSKLSCPPCHASAGQLTDGCLWNLCSPKVYWGLSMAGVIPATVKEKIKHWCDLYSKREMDKVVGAVEDIYSWQWHMQKKSDQYFPNLTFSTLSLCLKTGTYLMSTWLDTYCVVPYPH